MPGTAWAVPYRASTATAPKLATLLLGRNERLPKFNQYERWKAEQGASGNIYVGGTISRRLFQGRNCGGKIIGLRDICRNYNQKRV
ncbi:hypothetical protein MGG_13686 [Pyricularia oryzae 70-15]|uniref:Uncharacterized protein n=2 Tax=Pyricularia oryzae TaxID=318829 RepID=G4MMU0_PYRO7|nr:uncharacterized protein MGG_13686 [Pyricularia oryzae 70-15]EHA56170.1 hypothetical protein MGG_13686 [Pyricularia oryzae 70-15]